MMEYIFLSKKNNKKPLFIIFILIQCIFQIDQTKDIIIDPIHSCLNDSNLIDEKSIKKIKYSQKNIVSLLTKSFIKFIVYIFF